MNDTPHKDRLFLALFILIAGSVLLGGLIAPFAYSGLQLLGEHTDALTKLTDAPFERVANRCVMIVAAILLIPVIRLSGLARRLRTELKPSPIRWRELWVGMLLGLLSISVLYGIGWLLGVYRISDSLTTGSLLASIPMFILGALFIGLFEEIFFRGFVHGAFRCLAPGWLAILLSSSFFAGIHFLRPSRQPAEVPLDWNDGYALLGRLFDRFQWSADWPFVVTLFLMGLTLATFYEKRGDLFLVAGLHAGWVLALKLFSDLFDNQRELYQAVFLHHDNLAKAPVAIAAIAWFLAAAILSKPRQSKSG